MFLSVTASHAYEKADAFIVEALSGYYKVLSPVTINKKISLIVVNKTLHKLRGKLQRNGQEDLAFLTTAPGKSTSIEFEFDKSKKYHFIPLSPAFQEVELKIGEKSYEVPAQR